MEKLLKKAQTRLANNSRKGFTLVELIVVIVILAILIAALVPAILGVINQANRAADQADVRAVMMAGSVHSMQLNPPRAPDLNSSAKIMEEFTGEINIVPGDYIIAFDGAIAVGGILRSGDTRCGEDIAVGLSVGAFSGITTSQGTSSSGVASGSNYTFILVTHRPATS